jgi:Fe-S cluster biogenesis protein NfuA
MFIQTENTPNPNCLKFIPGLEIMGNNAPINIESKDEAKISELTEKLFEFDFVKAIFLGNDFISVTKDEEFTWDVIKPDILVTIMEFFVHDKKILRDNNFKQEPCYNEDDDEIVKQIKEIIEHRVRPAVAQDGGDITFSKFVDGVVYLQLKGACSGCPSSTVTLKDGIESMLKHYVPEVESVEAI